MKTHERRTGLRSDSESNDPPAFPELVQSMAKTAPLIEELRTDPKEKSQLARAVGVSKSTVYNWTRELMQYDLVEKTNDGYELTYLGQSHADFYAKWKRRSHRLSIAQPFIRGLPEDYQPPVALFESGDVVTATTNPDAPMDELLNCIAQSERVCGLFPVLSSRLLDELRATGDHRKTPCTVVVPETLRPEAGAILAERQQLSLDDVPHVDFRETGAALTFGLWLFIREKTAVGIGTYSSYGHLTGFFRTTSEAVLDWARMVYREWESDSRPLRAEDGTTDASS